MKKKVGIEIGIGIGLIILLSIIGISYALLRKTVYGESGKIILHGGKLDVILEEDSIPTIALTNAKPTKDADGAKSEQVYRFTVVNNSDSTVHYKIYLDDDNEYAEKVCGDNCSLLLDKDVKYEIKTNNSISVNTLDERKLREEFLEKKERKTYELRLWLNFDAGNDATEKNFFGKIRLEIDQTLKFPTGTEQFLADHVNDESIQDYDLNYNKEDSIAKENKMYVFNHTAGTQQSDWSEEELKDYRYIGADPNNYVTFNKEVAGWRIIGIETVDDGTGKKERRIKLVRKDPLTPDISWDNKPIGTGSSEERYGSSNWADSRLMMILNPGYDNNELATGGKGSLYWNRQSGSCPYGENDASISCNFEETGLLPEAQKMIGDATWFLGASTTFEDITAQMFYERERSETVYQSEAHPRKANWIGKVGLIYPSDYGYATSGGGTVDRNECLAKVLFHWGDKIDGIPDCRNHDWIYSSSNTKWTISSVTRSSGHLFRMYTDGFISYYYAYFSQGVYPVVYLVPNIKLLKGTGTETDPFEFV